MRASLWVVLSVGLLLDVVPAPTEAAIQVERWDLKTGYGYQYTNSSRPNNFQWIWLLGSAVIPLTDPAGPGWLRGRLEWEPELTVGLFIHPYDRPLAGATPLQFRWGLEGQGRLRPYGVLGAGVLYANVNRRETRKDLNFNLQGGLGAYWELNPSLSLVVEYRHIHLSNAGLHEDNAGLNTHTFLAGVSVRN